jgi:translation initiation factor IF-2
MKPPVVVRDLAQRMGIKAHLLLMQLMELNVFASINETLNEDVARKACERQGFLFEMERRERGAGISHPAPKKVETLEEEDRTADMLTRAPVVTVMGHVDHGKTSLLDAIRKTNVAAGESGGITQHIGASLVELPDGKTITFLDTPGHQAFTQMRARGANLTDIAVLVVAADDGLMPQTIEAMNHAKAAGVPIVVAINKCDLPAANPDRVRRQLQEKGITAESWGGDTIMVEVSAVTGKGIQDLLELILLQAEMMELKASPKRAAKGNVVEAQMEPGMGPTATVLVRKGTLRVGDAILIGANWGRIRALIDDKGKRVKQAGPAHAVKVVGLSGLPDAGAEFTVESDEKSARAIAEERIQAARARSAEPARQVTLQDMLDQFGETQKRKFRIVLKADVQGSLEALKESLAKITNEETDLELIHSAVGTITENDVLLASASKAVIIGFRVKTESGVTDAAKREGVAIKLYTVIYELLDQIEQSLEGLAKPVVSETVIGHAEIKQLFELSKGTMIAGCVVTDGRIARSGRIRVLRRDDVQFEGRLSSLRHFQNDVREVKAGQECGLRVDNFSGYQEGDIIECYVVEKAEAPA